jgi:lysophospholipase L1-like esterase
MARAAFSQVVKILSQVWTLLGIALLYLIIFEATARVGFAVRDRGEIARLTQLLLTSDIYRGKDWAVEYLRETSETSWVSRSDWHPYVYWRHAPYRGQYINIDANGIRYTWNSNPSIAPAQNRIFVFGSSALWGTAARDEFTIPSFLSKKLNASGPTFWVTNFGEEGFVSTQDLLTLMVELQKGNVPQVVVLYNGANDVFSAHQQGVAGVPQNEYNRVAEFNQFNWRSGIVEKLGLYRLGVTLANRSTRPVRSPGQDAALASAAVDIYIANMQTIESLAREYGFAVAFYWQPVIYTKNNLSPWEKIQLDTYGEERFFALAHQFLKSRELAKTHPTFHDLSDAFGDRSETVFLDLFHISEENNDAIADLILKSLPHAAQSSPQ